MWLWRSKFERGLIRRAKLQHVVNQPSGDSDDTTMSSIDIDDGFYSPVNQYMLGNLCALILAQAQADGALRVRLYYSSARMVYTLDGTDYDMVPVPTPMNVELARAVAKASGTSWGNHGNLNVSFADFALKFTISHQHDEQEDNSQEAQKYLEVTGFTGVAWNLYERKQFGHESSY